MVSVANATPFTSSETLAAGTRLAASIESETVAPSVTAVAGAAM